MTIAASGGEDSIISHFCVYEGADSLHRLIFVELEGVMPLDLVMTVQVRVIYWNTGAKAQV